MVSWDRAAGQEPVPLVCLKKKTKILHFKSENRMFSFPIIKSFKKIKKKKWTFINCFSYIVVQLTMRPEEYCEL